MKLDIHHYIYVGPDASAEILAAIAALDKKIGKLMSTSEDLAREVQETKDAVSALEGRYQAKIDELQAQTVTMQSHIDDLQTALDAGDTPAAQAAVAALNDLQTEMANVAAAPVEQPPAEEPPAPESARPE
jgi:chromosome segregation ATPase